MTDNNTTRNQKLAHPILFNRGGVGIVCKTIEQFKHYVYDLRERNQDNVRPWVLIEVKPTYLDGQRMTEYHFEGFYAYLYGKENRQFEGY